MLRLQIFEEAIVLFLHSFWAMIYLCNLDLLLYYSKDSILLVTILFNSHLMDKFF